MNALVREAYGRLVAERARLDRAIAVLAAILGEQTAPAAAPAAEELGDAAPDLIVRQIRAEVDALCAELQTLSTDPEAA